MVESDLSAHHEVGYPRETLVFSLDDGFVWASWPGTTASVRLGHHEAVTAVMHDFLSQCELAKRLEDTKASEG